MKFAFLHRICSSLDGSSWPVIPKNNLGAYTPGGGGAVLDISNEPNEEEIEKSQRRARYTP